MNNKNNKAGFIAQMSDNGYKKIKEHIKWMLFVIICTL